MQRPGGNPLLRGAAALKIRSHELSDAEWALLASLLYERRAPGRGFRDHRTVMNGMLWGSHTGAPWRDLPERYGPCESAYGRFQLWNREGLWCPPRIAALTFCDTAREPQCSVETFSGLA